jgi:hypothetical protein
MIVLLAAAGAMTAMAGESFPGQEPSRRVMKLQEKVDSLFEDKDYGRAMLIYREELAPLGDKYAQYMIGYMYLTGKGVAQDLIAASAWYRLSAERDQELFVSAREELLSMLDDEHRAQSDSAYLALRRELGDIALLSALITKDLEILRRFTMSRPAVMRSFEETFDKRRPVYVPVAQRLNQRLDYLINLGLSKEFGVGHEQQGIDRLEEEVLREIAKFNAMN